MNKQINNTRFNANPTAQTLTNNRLCDVIIIDITGV
jgi:hypothetical protein